MSIELPKNFTEHMEQLMGEGFPEYLESFSQESVQGIRVNTGKIPVEEFRKISPFALEPVPWTDNGFYVEADAPVTKHPYYYAGLYYVQEPSAMLPAALLGARPGERVLDLCAAPGGKATELGSRLAGEGLLVANDISASRAKALLKNLELHGIGNLMVCSETPEKLLDIYKNYFDRILVDAPCSGEGMFRREPAMRKSYEIHGPEYYAPLQRGIVSAAVRMLKPGGRMVYSTCTFSETENEETVLALLKEYPEMKLVEVTHIRGSESLPGKLPGCVRLYPHRVKGEGHFAALLEKQAHSGESIEASRKRNAAEKSARIPAQWQEFSIRFLKKDFSEWRIFQIEDRLYALPPGAVRGRKLRYLRTGLFLGECRQNRFEPSQALAMYLSRQEAAGSISFAAGDERVVRYLKGETIELPETEAAAVRDGWLLVCVDGFPLGWAKWVNGTLRNKYYAGWRMN